MVMYCLESELGLDNQAIIKEDNKLMLTLNPQFVDIDQEILDELREVLVIVLSYRVIELHRVLFFEGWKFYKFCDFQKVLILSKI